MAAALHVTCPQLRRRPSIVTHKAPGLAATDLRVQLDIRVTSPARTMLDCAPSLNAKRRSRLVADARHRGLLHVGQLTDVLARNLHHPGRIPLLELMDGLGNPTRSEFEEAFLAFCRRYGLPIPLINVMVAGREADAYFPDGGVIVELDGWEFHRDRHNFEDDRDKDVDRLLAGIVTVRVTWERMTQHPGREARRLHALLAARGSSPASGSGRAWA